MDLMTLGGLAVLGYFGIKAIGQKKGAGGAEGGSSAASSGFTPFPPEQQAAAWYGATGLQWTFAGEIGDNASRLAHTYRGKAQGEAGANRVTNDATFRKAMGDGFRIVVSPYVVNPGSELIAAGSMPYLLLVPDGFSRASIPTDWGPLQQLYAPPPGSFGAPLPGGGAAPSPFGQGQAPGAAPGTSDPFAEIPDAAFRSKIRDIATSPDTSLMDLDVTAQELDKAGFAASAAALRERRKQVALERSVEAKTRGGWLYVVRSGDIPFKVAQWYGRNPDGSVRPGALSEMSKTNPTVSPNNWKPGWQVGKEILLPGAWPDPSAKPAPPLAAGPLPPPPAGTPVPQPTPGPTPGAPTQVDTPWGISTPAAPMPPGTTQSKTNPGQEPFPIPWAPYVLFGPAYMGQWHPPSPGSWNPQVDNAAGAFAQG